MMSSEIFLNGNVAFLLPKKFSIYIDKKFLIFFYNNNFFKVIEKSEQTLSAEIFFKTLIDLSLDFFQKLCVTFSFGCFQIFWTHCMLLLYVITNKDSKFVTYCKQC
jgi:hypothetical protein